ncbi:bifunctional UDP-N-acetylglucosamine diphosphorylase/glucosamine-1-phosphate N-acetyltransferase GlmU [Janibacter cremeus]|uniref:bifunctional UDP-N-acetylglucosamine diphosphorylase/glucosamine-1-phosphate N-acetyltransferase GlmU n=1 Tax=Janibacter cremeus TaxID=1285192 RepID=UPI0023F917B1|nr:bifunctional UDP-N-acetylglucosamine diphosphorylase/glucosamine-1-phosphate N-acetyltransferase GlmU [Janibacter cremeus]WEV76660.1 bifunctional UDP-N-acetylglucosamine diphosphorylase/glucosamine-1-phosphate N-acetyltransferase GlmU [Janibacter cremeus]
MNDVRPDAVIILAAGEGTRMKSTLPKVLHPIGGAPLLGHAMRAASAAGAAETVVVVRHQRDRVAAFVEDFNARVERACTIADQDEIKGTGRAVECGLTALPADLTGTVVVTMGDVPLLSAETLTDLTRAHVEASAAVTVVTSVLDDGKAYGRIVRDADGNVERIVEFKDATDDERAITEINSGIYAFDAAVLRRELANVTTDNAQGEKYLTDVLQLARTAGGRVAAHVLTDLWQTEGVNDRVQLADLGKELNRRTCERHMRAGVTIVDPDTTWIDVDVSIGRDTTVLPGTQLLGATSIGAEAFVGPDVTLTDCEVGDGAEIKRTEGALAVIGAGATVGPYSYLRPGTVLGAKGKIGGFVETKNTTIGEGAKVPHLTYAGDADIRAGANIGAGTIFANYDGVAKHRTVVGRHSFVGSNSVLVAPVEVADGAYVAAGSAVIDDVGPGQLGVARGRQRNIEGWVDLRRAGTSTAAAAQAAAQLPSPEPTPDSSEDTQ